MSYRYMQENADELYYLTINIEDDREFLENLGIHEINVDYFLEGSYRQRTQYLRRRRGILDIWSFILIALLVGTGFSLYFALDDWEYGYALLGIGAFLSLIIIFGKFSKIVKIVFG